jgi:hypothetical protein
LRPAFGAAIRRAERDDAMQQKHLSIKHAQLELFGDYRWQWAPTKLERLMGEFPSLYAQEQKRKRHHACKRMDLGAGNAEARKKTTEY